MYKKFNCGKALNESSLGAEVALSLESVLRVCRVVDDTELPARVVVSVAAANHSVNSALLNAERAIGPAKRNGKLFDCS